MVEGQIVESFYSELDKVAQTIDEQQSAQKPPADEDVTSYWVCPNCGASKEATDGIECQQADACGHGGRSIVERERDDCTRQIAKRSPGQYQAFRAFTPSTGAAGPIRGTYCKCQN
jgi:hypothetical protein